MSVILLNLDYLFFPYKEELIPYYRKYFNRKNENILFFRNHPIVKFAQDYVSMGKSILKHLDDHVFIRYEYDRYSDTLSVRNDTHKYKASERIIKIVDSIKEYGYCRGKYGHTRYMVRVTKGFSSPLYSDSEGYTLKSRKHRAAACIALGYRQILVKGE